MVTHSAPVRAPPAFFFLVMPCPALTQGQHQGFSPGPDLSTDWPAASLLFYFSHLQQTNCPLVFFFFLVFFQYSQFHCSRQYLILWNLRVNEDSSFLICLSECPCTEKVNLIRECWCKKHECNFLKFCMRCVGATTYLSYPANLIS